MNIIIVGLGSMGKRRLRLLKQYSSDKKICMGICGVDTNMKRAEEVSREYDITVFEDLRTAVEDKKNEGEGERTCVFVCTAPITHGAIINTALELDCNVFTEINLVADEYEENISLADKKGLTLFLSSTMLYRNEIKKINEIIKNTNGTANYRYHSGQFLKDWHPWKNYTDFFVADKRTNGCREIFAIELPWIVKCFGAIVDMKVMAQNASSLPLGYPDSYEVLVRHKSGSAGSLCVDVISKKATRELEIYGENIAVTWDGTPDGLKCLNKEKDEMEQISLYEAAEHKEGYNKTIIEDAYYSEIENFFAVVLGKEKPFYDFKRDFELLKRIDLIEEEGEKYIKSVGE